MIIVSQDKDAIINFDNIEALWIRNPFEIYVSTTIDNQYSLAKYDKEERAKEVFQEIIIALNSDSKIYEMPKE